MEHSFLTLISTLSPDNHMRGVQLENLCKWLLETDPRYKSKLEKVWLWDDWPERWGPDCGIDLVARDTEGKTWAIQAKCYAPEYSVTKHDIDKFLSESSNEKIDQRLLIATTDGLGANAKGVIERQNPTKPINLLMLSDLLEAPVEWPKNLAELSSGQVKKAYSPKPYQQIAIDKVVNNIDQRGQLIMACGTGKTLTALWIAEKLQHETTLVLLPSLLLLSKTLTEWLTHSKTEFSYLPVCSDSTVSKSADDIQMTTSDLSFPSTTDLSEIAKFIKRPGRKVIFSTYQSSPQIAEAYKTYELKELGLIVADEAHRCAGKPGTDYTTALFDENIPAKQRLFMTATPRIFQARIQKKASESGVDVVSMDNEEVFGPALHKLTFGQAIKDSLLSDYQVVIVGINNSLYADMITNRRLIETEEKNIQSDAQSFASHIGLAKAIKKYDLRRVISFHSRVSAARDFSGVLPDVVDWMSEASRPEGELVTNFVSGEMSTFYRNKSLRVLGEIAPNQRCILSNARCLSEGVDVPALDGVAFIDPKNSEIDIVQAVGRAIRTAEGKVIGTIVIPVFIPEDEEAEDILNSSPFKKVWAIVNALRSHDEDMGVELDSLRQALGKRGSVGRPKKIYFDLPTNVTESFEQALDVKLLETTTASWEFWYGLLCDYVENNGHCLVPAKYKTETGYRVGSWLQVQRQSKESLSAERKARLEALGFVWHRFEQQWEEGYEALKVYHFTHGHCLVPGTHKTDAGYSLGRWINKQRMQKNSIPTERKERLEALGFVWNVIEQQWEEAYEALKTYQSIHGHCHVPTGYKTEAGCSLGTWVKRQRKFKESLSAERKARLEALGFVWNPQEQQWEEGYEALKIYQSTHGHCLVPARYKTEMGYKLGGWVGLQRGSKESLSAERKARLDSLGFVWHRFEQQWEEAYEALKTYQSIHGHCHVPTGCKTEAGYSLGGWVHKLRMQKNSIPRERKERLEALGFVWGVLEQQWEEGYEVLKTYQSIHGHCRVPAKYKTEAGYKLGVWVGTQRQSKESLSAERKARLEALGFVWNPQEQQWEEGYEALKVYHSTHGHCLVPGTYKTEAGYSLGRWVSKQRTKKDVMLTERKSRLDALGFIWDARK
jgi:superfamily II DNA or RNA helicase